MKKCFKCQETKPYSEYYKHSQMADGHVNKCKECNKKDVIENRDKKLDYYREYDRKRGNRQNNEDIKKYRSENPIKYKAHGMVNNAIRDKKLYAEPCEVCGSTHKIHAHHNDYSKPLNVRWLCSVHHFEWHKKNGEGLNGR